MSKDTKNQISFRPLCEDDLKLLHQWFQLPHIKRWYARNKTYSFEAIKNQYLPRIHAPEKIPNYIIVFGNTPIGYIQLYHLDSSLPDGVTNYNHPLFETYDPKDIAGIDLFIADENFLHKGYGAKTLNAFINNYIKDTFKAVVADPMRNNQMAIEFFKRMGFVEDIETSKESQNILLLLKLNLKQH